MTNRPASDHVTSRRCHAVVMCITVYRVRTKPVTMRVYTYIPDVYMYYIQTYIVVARLSAQSYGRSVNVLDGGRGYIRCRLMGMGTRCTFESLTRPLFYGDFSEESATRRRDAAFVVRSVYHPATLNHRTGFFFRIFYFLVA